MSFRTPKYRLHKASGQALIQVNGERIYLGKYGSKESKEKYQRILAQWLVRQRTQSVAAPVVAASVTLNELILAYLRHVKIRYVKNGEPTSEQRSFRTALRPVRDLYGRSPAAEFGPLALVACRQRLIEAGICRKRINQHVTRIRQMFKWGVAREMVPVAVWHSLGSVEGLKRGEAPESKPVRPVPESYISAIESHVTPQIWAMIQLQLWTACRPGEVCNIRTGDITMNGEVWEYVPGTHKSEHHDKQRVIYLGPHAQAIIRPWLKVDRRSHLFSPREAREWFHAQRAIKAKCRRSSSKRKSAPLRSPGEYYTTNTYGHAISRGCSKAEVPRWSPNQLRHNAATRIRSEYGIEAARIILGHSSAVTSEIYAEVDREKAAEIMRKIG